MTTTVRLVTKYVNLTMPIQQGWQCEAVNVETGKVEILNPPASDEVTAQRQVKQFAESMGWVVV